MNYRMLLTICTLFFVLPSDLVSAQTKKPNLIIVLCDDLGWGDVGYHGTNKVTKTPNLDAMAKASVRFNSFHSTTSICSPTRGSVLTGRSPTRYGIYGTRYPLPRSEVTIADVLRMFGYRSGHFGKWHLGGLRANQITSPANQGFDTWFSILNSYQVPRIDTKGFVRDGATVPQLKGFVDDVVFDEALKFIRANAGKKQPFFAHICTLSPHGIPNEAPDRLRKYFPGLSEDQQHVWGMIAAIDENVGRLREELRKLGIEDDTIVLFTSDNGQSRFNPYSGGKGTIREGGLRVPCLIEWPGRIRTPFQTEMPAYTCDILPTFLEIAGGTLPKDALPLDGISLLPVLDGKVKERPNPIVFHYEDGADKNKSKLGQNGFAVLEGNWRYVTTLDDKQSALYDLAKDPGEKTDIAATHPEVVARLKDARDRWWVSVRADPHYRTFEQAQKLRDKTDVD